MNVASLRSSHRNKAVLAVLAVALVAAGWWIFGGGETAAPAPPSVPVGVIRAEQRDVPHMASGIGTVESLHNVTLRPQVEGVLAEVLFQEGQMVRKGDLLARIDDRSIAAALAQAQAEKARNEAQLRAAEQDLTRYENLVKEEAISRQTVEQQQGTVGELRAAVNASAAAVAAAQVQLSYTRITAPVTGRVGLRRVDPGNLVRASDSDGLVTVAQIAPISVVFSLPQTLLTSVQPLLKQPDRALVTAYDRDNGTPLAEGRLSMIDNQIDTATGTIKLRAEFDNADGSLWPGQFVTVRLQIGQSPKATVVSPRAVKQGLDGPFVFRINNGKAEVVPVTLGYTTDSEVVITSGIAPGETIVSDGQSRLKDGAPVKIVEGEGAAAVAEETP
ncbi:efflux RND transporter periplasmic adaptor subunit [Emcibacter sp. SYSU 3D8]|uniref:efflux RND transporter periplasmic adaptor subunit n=1 Tax=Emcibacter sp. SYSU 3D8 TaxID=3133969 RepID=UPI0031FEAD93